MVCELVKVTQQDPCKQHRMLSLIVTAAVESPVPLGWREAQLCLVFRKAVSDLIQL